MIILFLPAEYAGGILLDVGGTRTSVKRLAYTLRKEVIAYADNSDLACVWLYHHIKDHEEKQQPPLGLSDGC